MTWNGQSQNIAWKMRLGMYLNCWPSCDESRPLSPLTNRIPCDERQLNLKSVQFLLFFRRIYRVVFLRPNISINPSTHWFTFTEWDDGHASIGKENLTRLKRMDAEKCKMKRWDDKWMSRKDAMEKSMKIFLHSILVWFSFRSFERRQFLLCVKRRFATVR